MQRLCNGLSPAAFSPPTSATRCCRNSRHADCALAEPKAPAAFKSRIQESTSAALKQQRHPVSNLEKQATTLNYVKSDPKKIHYGQILALPLSVMGNIFFFCQNSVMLLTCEDSGALAQLMRSSNTQVVRPRACAPRFAVTMSHPRAACAHVKIFKHESDWTLLYICIRRCTD